MPTSECRSTGNNRGATRPGSLLSNRAVFVVANIVVNIVRPIPFVIFLIAIQRPLLQPIIGTTIGTNAVTFALSLSAAFAVSRIIEQNLLTVDPGSSRRPALRAPARSASC